MAEVVIAAADLAQDAAEATQDDDSRVLSKVYCGVTALALIGLAKQGFLGLCDFWTDVSVVLEWRHSGEDDFFRAGFGCLLASGLVIGSTLWLYWVMEEQKLTSWKQCANDPKSLFALIPCMVAGLLGLAPAVAVALMLRSQDRVGRDGLAGIERGTTVLTALAVAEILFEILPQTTLQTYVGVSYGQYTFASPEFNWLLVFSAFIGFVSGGLGAVAGHSVSGEPVSLFTPHGLCLFIGRTGQLASSVFVFALLGCAFKTAMSVLFVGFVSHVMILMLWTYEPVIRDVACGPLRPLLMNTIPSLTHIAMLDWFFTSTHVDNNYANSTQPVWLYTYTNSSDTELAIEVSIDRIRVREFCALHAAKNPGNEDLPFKYEYQHAEFQHWPELATGGTIPENAFSDNTVLSSYNGLVVQPLPANGTGLWSTPFAYDCRMRNSGLYPTYILIALSFVGMVLTFLLDPRCGITESAKTCRDELQTVIVARQKELQDGGKIHSESQWGLYIHPDGRELFGLKAMMDHRFRSVSMTMPLEGVKSVHAYVGTTFDTGYTKAQLDVDTESLSEQRENQVVSTVENPVEAKKST